MQLYKRVNYYNDYLLRPLFKEIKIGNFSWYVDSIILSSISEFWNTYFLGSGSIKSSDKYELDTNIETFKVCMDILHSYPFLTYKQRFTDDDILYMVCKNSNFYVLSNIFSVMDMWLIDMNKIIEDHYLYIYENDEDDDTEYKYNCLPTKDELDVILSNDNAQLKIMKLFNMDKRYRRYWEDVFENTTIQLLEKSIKMNNTSHEFIPVNMLFELLGEECFYQFLEGLSISVREMMNYITCECAKKYLIYKGYDEKVVDVLRECIRRSNDKDCWKFLYSIHPDLRKTCIPFLSYNDDIKNKYIIEDICADILYFGNNGDILLNVRPTYWFMINKGDFLYELATQNQDLSKIELIHKAYNEDIDEQRKQMYKDVISKYKTENNKDSSYIEVLLELMGFKTELKY